MVEGSKCWMEWYTGAASDAHDGDEDVGQNLGKMA
jgi:hypothetical protein